MKKIRDGILRRERDDSALKKDVVEMRNKMRAHLDRSSDKLYDIKQGRGGMIDVEFISQYLILKYAPTHPDLKLWTDNVRILEECSRLNLISVAKTSELINAYIEIRKIYHELSLADLPRLVLIEHRPPATLRVEKIWNELFSEDQN